MAEYAQYLVNAGHAVDIITSKPGAPKVVRKGGLTIYYDQCISHPILSNRIRYLRFYTFTWSASRRLIDGNYDVAHTWLYPYGLALRLARRVRGTPYLYHNMAEGVGWPSPIDKWFVRQVVRAADEVAALTPRSAANVQREVGVPVSVLPPCVDMDTFAPVVKRDLHRPRVLFVSDLYVFRKGLSLLLMAWEQIYRKNPRAILTLAGPFGQGRMGVEDTDWDPFQAIKMLVRDPGARAAIEVLGEGQAGSLPYQYARASVTVLPSIGDVFGLVLAESLACGTPVVGSAFEGPGDIITDPAIGATVPITSLADLYNPDRAAELAEAILFAMGLASDPASVARSREHAQQWSRQAVGTELEKTYAKMLEPRTRRSPAGAA